MKQLNDEQLTMRIESFIARKHQEFPELALRGDKRHAESIGYVITDKVSSFVSSFKMTKLAH